ncbi:MAG TPA: hypothetical protein PLG14_10140 [Spirochaetales bacterium]|nr:hypothetical protein [Spirochaetales bacterium]
MDQLIQNLRYESTTVQALGVTVGGLVGVFATLGVFFLVIWISGKLGKKSAE